MASPPDLSSEDYYAILGASRDASATDISKAYRKLALKHHPDKNPDDKDGATQRFRKITAAYDVLRDVERRKLYDTEGAAAGAGAGMSAEEAETIFQEFLRTAEGCYSNVSDFVFAAGAAPENTMGPALSGDFGLPKQSIPAPQQDYSAPNAGAPYVPQSQYPDDGGFDTSGDYGGNAGTSFSAGRSFTAPDAGKSFTGASYSRGKSFSAPDAGDANPDPQFQSRSFHQSNTSGAVFQGAGPQPKAAREGSGPQAKADATSSPAGHVVTEFQHRSACSSSTVGVWPQGPSPSRLPRGPLDFGLAPAKAAEASQGGGKWADPPRQQGGGAARPQGGGGARPQGHGAALRQEYDHTMAQGARDRANS